jgi:hypothetical protein
MKQRRGSGKRFILSYCSGRGGGKKGRADKGSDGKKKDEFRSLRLERQKKRRRLQ